MRWRCRKAASPSMRMRLRRNGRPMIPWITTIRSRKYSRISSPALTWWCCPRAIWFPHGLGWDRGASQIRTATRRQHRAFQGRPGGAGADRAERRRGRRHGCAGRSSRRGRRARPRRFRQHRCDAVCGSQRRCHARAYQQRPDLTGVLRVKGHARIADKAAPIVVQGVGGRVDLAFARPDVKQTEHLVVIGLKGFDGDAVRRALQG